MDFDITNQIKIDKWVVSNNVAGCIDAIEAMQVVFSITPQIPNKLNCIHIAFGFNHRLESREGGNLFNGETIVWHNIINNGITPTEAFVQQVFIRSSNAYKSFFDDKTKGHLINKLNAVCPLSQDIISGIREELRKYDLFKKSMSPN